MNGDERIAVITPALNSAETIAEALASLSRQSFVNWVSVVVDDGSSDRTGEIVARLALQDGRFTLIRNECTVGASASRNRALASTEATWACFLDADDWLADDALERLIARAREDGCDAVHGGVLRVAAGGELVPLPRAYGTPNLLGLLARTPALPIHSCIVRAEVVREAGGFDETLVTCEDWDLWQRLTRDGCRWGAVAEYVAFYRMRSTSASQNARQMLEDGMLVIDRGHRVGTALGQRPTEAERLLARTYLACAAAGTAIASGTDAAGLLDLLGGDISPLTAADIATRVVLEAVTTGRAASPRDWSVLPDHVWGAIRAFLQALGRRLGKPRFVRDAAEAAERLVVEHQREPGVRGRWQRIDLELGEPCRLLRSPESVDRVICRVTQANETLGAVECVSADGSLPAVVLADAVSGELAWPILGRFLEASIGHEVDVEVVSGRASVRRRGALLYEGSVEEAKPPFEAAMDHAGWTLFMQELWGAPDSPLESFYDPAQEVGAGARELTVREDSIVVEVAEELPDLVGRDPVTAAVTIGGTPFCLVRLTPSGGRVSAARLRRAINVTGGVELVRAVVRNALLRGSLPATSLRVQLKEAASRPSTVAADLNGHNGVVRGWGRAVGGDLEQLQQMTLIGPPPGATIGVAASRAAVLPVGAGDAVMAAATASHQAVVRIGDQGLLLRAPFVLDLAAGGRLRADDFAPPRARAGTAAERLQRIARIASHRSRAADPVGAARLRVLSYTDAAVARAGLVALSLRGRRVITLDEWARAVLDHQAIDALAVALVFRLAPRELAHLAAAGHAESVHAGTVLVEAAVLADATSEDAASLRSLASAGATIGLVAGADLADLAPEPLAHWLVHRRAAIEYLAGTPPSAIAFFDAVRDRGVAQIAGACGFSYGLVVAAWEASFADPLLAIPATPVHADTDLEELLT